jgi:outer membrane protein OmpA-like peptidoglycan-associated protein
VSSAPLYVEDLVLFATNSSDIAPDFVPLLELGMALLTQNPQVTITVIGHTDAVGTPEYNLALSERRVASVIGWFTDRGVDPARLVGEARGLTDPLVPAEPGRAEALNRRVEFIITGLLEG